MPVAREVDYAKGYALIDDTKMVTIELPIVAGEAVLRMVEDCLNDGIPDMSDVGVCSGIAASSILAQALFSHPDYQSEMRRVNMANILNQDSWPYEWFKEKEI